jgi:hypothetical protein
MTDAAFFVNEQTGKARRLRAQGFTGVDVDLVDGRWALWSAGRIVGHLEPDQDELAMGLRPLLRPLEEAEPAKAGEGAVHATTLWRAGAFLPPRSAVTAGRPP